ncbi:MAG: CrcB family protein [Flavobacteriaceae bacterium]|nr:CrcB family protein [Flavobacteriaceae bacterium]
MGIGGFIGTILRFLIARYFVLSFDSVFPWGTFIVNILGSLLIGIIMGFSEKGALMSQEWTLFLTVGICGRVYGLFLLYLQCTCSYSLPPQNKEILRFASYAGFSFFLGLLAVFAGRAITKMI